MKIPVVPRSEQRDGVARGLSAGVGKTLEQQNTLSRD